MYVMIPYYDQTKPNQCRTEEDKAGDERRKTMTIVRIISLSLLSSPHVPLPLSNRKSQTSFSSSLPWMDEVRTFSMANRYIRIRIIRRSRTKTSTTTSIIILHLTSQISQFTLQAAPSSSYQ